MKIVYLHSIITPLRFFILKFWRLKFFYYLCSRIKAISCFGNLSGIGLLFANTTDSFSRFTTANIAKSTPIRRRTQHYSVTFANVIELFDTFTGWTCSNRGVSAEVSSYSFLVTL